MSEDELLRERVRTRYASLSRTGAPTSPSFGGTLYASEAAGLPSGAVAGSLGCGNPVAVAELRPGETVLDLGSGAGVDVILSARRVGPTGTVYGLDMTDEMLAAARQHIAEAGVGNVHLLRGVIENIPLPAESVDVVISNCVINLSSDRLQVLAEIARVLRPGGRLGVSDVVADDRLSPQERVERGSAIGCIAGTLAEREYVSALVEVGLEAVRVRRTHQVGDGLHAAIVHARKPATVEVVPLEAGHWPDVVRIYAAGISTGNATFESAVPTWEEWDATHLGSHRFVAVSDGRVVGWTAVSSVSDRCVYGGVVESSVYVDEACRGAGVGRLLLEHLVASTEAAGIWTIQAGIFPENAASVRVHERTGFTVVGRRSRLGKLDGSWRDVLLLERRSERIV